MNIAAFRRNANRRHRTHQGLIICAAITAVNMLGTSLFLGPASLFMAPVFGRGRLERTIRLAFIANGVVCLGSGLALLLDNAALIFLLTTFGLGGTLLFLFGTLALYFRLVFS